MHGISLATPIVLSIYFVLSYLPFTFRYSNLPTSPLYPLLKRLQQYYTDYAYSPVRSIAEASTTGHGTNIITGMAVGMKSTVVPCLTVSVAVITAYHLGKNAGLGEGHSGGLFGTAVATMGMLSSAVYVLAMNNFGEI